MLRKYPGIDGQMATPWGCRRLLACWPHEAKQSYIRTLRAGFRSTRFSCGQCAGLFRRLHTACAYCLRRRSAASLGCIRTARGRRGTASHGRLLAWRALAIRRQAGLPICRRVFLMGHSAGAHMAALLTLDPRYFAAAGGPAPHMPPPWQRSQRRRAAGLPRSPTLPRSSRNRPDVRLCL